MISATNDAITFFVENWTETAKLSSFPFTILLLILNFLSHPHNNNRVFFVACFLGRSCTEKYEEKKFFKGIFWVITFYIIFRFVLRLTVRPKTFFFLILHHLCHKLFGIRGENKVDVKEKFAKLWIKNYLMRVAKTNKKNWLWRVPIAKRILSVLISLHHLVGSLSFIFDVGVSPMKFEF